MKVSLLLIFIMGSHTLFATIETIAEPDIKWTKLDLVVCFGEKSDWSRARISDEYGYGVSPREDEALTFSIEQKELIQKIVIDNYTKETTGINFTGWSNCDVIKNPDVIVFRTHKSELSPSGFASIGRQAVPFWEAIEGHDQSGFKRDTRIIKVEYVLLDTYKTSPKVSFEEKLKYTSIHEFGHIAGLRHEHARLNDALKDPNCIEGGLQDAPSFLQEKEGLSSTSFGQYDPNSIMNYCFKDLIHFKTGLTFTIKSNDSLPISLVDETLYTKAISVEGMIKYNIKISLSNLDKHSLRCMYVYPEDIVKNICIPGFHFNN